MIKMKQIKCKATTNAGNPCLNDAVIEGYCIMHFLPRKSNKNKEIIKLKKIIEYHKFKIEKYEKEIMKLQK